MGRGACFQAANNAVKRQSQAMDAGKVACCSKTLALRVFEPATRKDNTAEKLRSPAANGLGYQIHVTISPRSKYLSLPRLGYT